MQWLAGAESGRERKLAIGTKEPSSAIFSSVWRVSLEFRRRNKTTHIKQSRMKAIDGNVLSCVVFGGGLRWWSCWCTYYCLGWNSVPGSGNGCNDFTLLAGVNA